MSVEGFSEDALSVPDPGLDQARVTQFGFESKPPAGGVDSKHEGVTAPSALPGEPGSNGINLTLGENDFPRQTGSDSMPDEVVPLT